MTQAMRKAHINVYNWLGCVNAYEWQTGLYYIHTYRNEFSS